MTVFELHGGWNELRRDYVWILRFAQDDIALL